MVNIYLLQSVLLIIYVHPRAHASSLIALTCAGVFMSAIATGTHVEEERIEKNKLFVREVIVVVQ
jgi:hypothetical protein